MSGGSSEGRTSVAFWNRDGNERASGETNTEALGNSDAAAARGSDPAGREVGGLAPAMVTQTISVRQSLGRETTVTGKLSFNAPTRIDGVLNGEVRASDLLVIGEEGKVDGAVRAQQLLVLGEVRGEVQVEGRTEIGATGKLRGSLQSRHLVVHAGAFLEGDMKIGPR